MQETVGAKLFKSGSAGDDARYLNEQSMVEDLSAFVTSQTGPVRCREVTYEFDYRSGRADLVGLGNRGSLHAFETKLHKWREALHQAWRNACFAHYCYVALPELTASVALKAKHEFQRHGVGLLILSRHEAKLAIPPRRNAPLLPWLTKAALSRFSPGTNYGK